MVCRYLHGVLKDSSINSSWKICNFKIYKFNEYGGPLQNDTNVVFTFNGENYVICNDSTIGLDQFCVTPIPNNYRYAKLKKDSTFIYNYWSGGGNTCYVGGGFASPGNWMMFRGKKVSNYTSIEDFSLGAELVFFPNPVIGTLNIKSPYVINEIEVFDITGKKLQQSFYFEADSYKINLSNMDDGMYFINVKTSRGCVMRKIIKQK